MQDMPSSEELDRVWKRMQSFAPDHYQSVQRYRVAIISGLTPPHRAIIGDALGHCAVADNKDIDKLIQKIDTILTPGERDNIMSALDAHMDDQHAMSIRVAETITREFPDLVKKSNPVPQSSPQDIRPRPAVRASRVLANWLVHQAIESNGSETAKHDILVAFGFSGPNNHADPRTLAESSP